MAAITENFDLAGMRLHSGEGRRLELEVAIDEFTLSGDTYTVSPTPIPVVLDISKTAGDGYALRLRFSAQLAGACMRCLEPATEAFTIDAREVYQPGHAGDDDDVESDYLDQDGALELKAWANDALALALPAAILCRPDCAGLCAVCGENLNTAEPGHHHEQGPDPRWAKLSELEFE
jgi:uncharacterized protein